MNYIKIEKLADGQYEDLSDLVDNSLSIYDEDGQQVEFTVEDLMVDEIGIVYAPTGVKTHEEVSSGHDDIPGGRSEMRQEFINYQPLKVIIKNQN